MQFNSLQELQQHLLSFSDPGERQMAEMAAILGTAAQRSQKKHIVVLLHGMNTNAEWQEALAEPMRNETNLDPRVVGYGNFHPFKFWLPLVFRPGRIRKVLTDLRGIRERNPDADISIVAHSFGTYIVSRVLATATDLKFHRVLLCGAIVNTDYDWSAVSERFTEPAVNDIGRRDFWPSMAKSWSWGFGDSGCIGFQNSMVRDRHFTYGHSGFLNVDHMRKYWLPYLIDGRVITPRFNLKRKAMKFGELIFRKFSWSYLFATIGVIWAIGRWIVAPVWHAIWSV